jgi:hypothetical protein
MGYVKHAREITLDGEPGRMFRPEGVLGFSEQTCFILTDTGISYARSLLQESAGPDEPALAAPSADVSVSPNGDGRSVSCIPHWDADLRELSVAGQPVKRFRTPSPNQERVLSAFQEEGWPCHIDDPLPPVADQTPKRRLHDTIKCLNRRQIKRLIRFLGDGAGQGVRWEPMLLADSAPQ